MRIELTEKTKALLQALLPEGGDPSPLIEAALAELIDQRVDQQALTCYDPETGRVYSFAELRAELQRGLEDGSAGRVDKLDTDALKRRGRQRLATRDA